MHILCGLGLVVINTRQRRYARYSMSSLFLSVEFSEVIQMPFDVVGRLEPRNCVLDGHAH